MNRRSLLALIALLLVVTLLLVPLPFAWSLGWRAALLDLGHVPLFAGSVLVLWYGLRLKLCFCVLIAVAVAGLAEVVQPLLGRTASWWDFLNGSLGAAAIGAILYARQQRNMWHATGLVFSALAFAGWPLFRTAPILHDAIEGYEDFPTLAGFQTRRELRRWETNQAELHREYDSEGQWSARITFLPGPADYPSAMLTPVIHDLSEFRWLCVSFTGDGEPLELALSVRGGPVEGNHTNHYQIAETVPPGFHTMRLNLDAAMKFAQPHGLDLKDVCFVQLFVVRPRAARTIHLRRVWVEK